MTNQVVVDSRFENEPYKVVYKYRMELSALPLEVLIPVGARLLHVEYLGNQLDRHYLAWYEVDLAHTTNFVRHIYQTFGTGDRDIPKMAKHIATGIEWEEWQLRSNRANPVRVWHLYEYPTGARIEDV